VRVVLDRSVVAVSGAWCRVRVVLDRLIVAVAA
jgi:hypothetical protein